MQPLLSQVNPDAEARPCKCVVSHPAVKTDLSLLFRGAAGVRKQAPRWSDAGKVLPRRLGNFKESTC